MTKSMPRLILAVQFSVPLWIGGLLSITFLSLLSSCNKASSRRVNDIAGSTTTSDTPPSGSNDPAPADPTGDAKSATKIVAEDLSITDLFTKDAVQDNCVTATFTAYADTEVVKDVEMVFSYTPAGDANGKVEPSSAKTDANGQASTTYCSGDKEGKFVILAKAGELSANSAEVSVKQKPVYKFVYTRTDLPVVQTPTTGTPDVDASVISLNLLDSGPNDCTFLYFKLTKSDAPIVGETLVFRTQVDFPKGAKLARKENPGLTQVEAVTLKKYAYFSGTSNTGGEFAIPICAGTSLGTMLVSATFVDDENKPFTAQSPVIRITAGLTNYQNMSLTYDPKNAKTLRGFFNTNSPFIQPFTVKLGARQDGDPIIDYPVSIAAETGKIVINNGGTPDKVTGEVGFTMQPLHMVDYRPYPVNIFGTNNQYPEAQTHCDPIQIASAGGITYKNLAKNWRSTMVYSIRGQETFNDANHNGIYDVGGDGFWDKNQNGYYDAGDVITYDAGNDGKVDMNGEWFIDLPAPFIDVDEDGVYTPNKDILIGDEYFAPNGKRDADALLWKYDYIPIYMGASPYALLHAEIKTPFNMYDTDTIGTSYYTNLANLGLRSPLNLDPTSLIRTASDTKIGQDELFGTVPAPNQAKLASYAYVNRYIFAHGICGNPLPGDSNITVNFEDASKPVYGDRNFYATFYTQPGDQIREPSRRLLKEANGSSTAKINFNVVDHPAADAGYPVEFSLHVSPCNNSCTGALAQAGVACDAKTQLVHVSADSETITVAMSIPKATTCSCIASASLVNDVCTCNGGLTYDPATGTCH